MGLRVLVLGARTSKFTCFDSSSQSDFMNIPW